MTNKNRTAIAPTYTIKNSKAKNSHSSMNKNMDVATKHRIREIIECRGVLIKTTTEELIKMIKDKNIKEILIWLAAILVMKEGFEPSTLGLWPQHSTYWTISFFQLHVPVQLPCYDFIQITDFIIDSNSKSSNEINSLHVTGGVYKAK